MRIVRGGGVSGGEMMDSPSKVAAVTLKRLERVRWVVVIVVGQ